MGLARSALKIGILGGTIYVTIVQGIWADSKTTLEAVQKVSYVTPVTERYIEQLQRTDEVNTKVAHYWNSGVQYSFSALAQLPTFVGNGITTGIAMAKDTVKTISEKPGAST